jgi:hypothetical protein
VALGETAVGALGAAIGDLHGPEELFLEPVGALVVELLVGGAQVGERETDLLYGVGDRPQQVLARFPRDVGHAWSVALVGAAPAAAAERVPARQLGHDRLERVSDLGGGRAIVRGRGEHGDEQLGERRGGPAGERRRPVGELGEAHLGVARLARAGGAREGLLTGQRVVQRGPEAEDVGGGAHVARDGSHCSGAM